MYYVIIAKYIDFWLFEYHTWMILFYFAPALSHLPFLLVCFKSQCLSVSLVRFLPVHRPSLCCHPVCLWMTLVHPARLSFLPESVFHISLSLSHFGHSLASKSRSIQPVSALRHPASHFRYWNGISFFRHGTCSGIGISFHSGNGLDNARQSGILAV